MDPSALQDENASVFNQSTSLRNHPSPTPQSTNSGGTASFTSVSRLPLGNLALNSPSSSFTTPRRRKKPGVRAGTDLVVCRVEPWPRIGRTVPLHLLKETSQEINGHDTKNWQMKLARKVLEGHDAIGIAGTGAGKSLVFGLLALAAELAGFPGIINLTAVEINEDNKDNKVFTRLEEGQYRLCYASPECLLRSNRFKQLFRTEEFRRKLVAMVVDEAHVIEAWKDEFRKDYGELAALKIIVGTEVPWLALTATCSTRTFEIIYTTLGMGESRPFHGIDLCSDRPNLAQWVRPMEYSKISMADLLAFLPQAPQNLSDFDKIIFYFLTRQQALRACTLCRSLITSPELRKGLLPFTAVNSEAYKETVMGQNKSDTGTRQD
ncbi:unnamed protein product [Cyclocybe aegerita]|uniref:DNA 3'-5' helicase n=1 Tax=Cyclocybe aegerita TaxID=1973307 RepID=A0A8S0WBT1_CYCAE|nr:unnamed protein product [Cyclocybe aegerita]